MSPDALPQPPAPTDDEREAAACAWADHRKHYGADPNPIALGRDHQNYLAGYYDGRREQRDADKLARSDKNQGTEPVYIDAGGRLAAMDARKRYTAHHAGSRDPLSGEDTVIWEAGYRFAVDDETHPHPLGMLGRWLDYWGSSPTDGDQRITFALGYHWREHERQTTTEQESTTMPENTEPGFRFRTEPGIPATWAPTPIPVENGATPAMQMDATIRQALADVHAVGVEDGRIGPAAHRQDQAETIADALAALVQDYANQWAADHPSYPGRRVVVIDLESGRWLRPSDAITGAEGARAASSLLPGTTEEELAAFYDAHMTDPEPAQALVGELSYFSGSESLPVVAARLAVDLLAPSIRPGAFVDPTEDVTKRADTLLAWLRKETGEPGPLPAMDLGEAENAEAERPSMGEAIATELAQQKPTDVLDDTTGYLGQPFPTKSVVQITEQLQADLKGWSLSPTEGDRLTEVVTRRTVHGMTDATRTPARRAEDALRGATLTPEEAAPLHAFIDTRTRHPRETGGESLRRVPFDQLPDGVYCAASKPLTHAPEVFVRYKGSWLSTTRTKAAKAREDARDAHNTFGLGRLRFA